LSLARSVGVIRSDTWRTGFPEVAGEGTTQGAHEPEKEKADRVTARASQLGQTGQHAEFLWVENDEEKHCSQ
jgi:hypothetical protein